MIEQRRERENVVVVDSLKIISFPLFFVFVMLI